MLFYLTSKIYISASNKQKQLKIETKFIKVLIYLQ